MAISALKFLTPPKSTDLGQKFPLPSDSKKKATIHFRLEFNNLPQMPVRFLVLMGADAPIPDSVLEFFKQASLAIDLEKKRADYPCLKRHEYTLFIYDEILCAATRIKNFRLQNQETLHIEIQMAGEIAIKTTPKSRNEK